MRMGLSFSGLLELGPQEVGGISMGCFFFILGKFCISVINCRMLS